MLFLFIYSMFIYTATHNGEEHSFKATGRKMAFRMAINKLGKSRPIKVKNDETGEIYYIME